MLDTKTTARIVCCVALALGTVAIAAQQRATPAEGQRGDLDEIRKVSTLIGTNVMNRANNNVVADVRDLVLSPGGDVQFMILGHGGVGGVGETYTAAPSDALEVRQIDGKWAVSLDKTAEDLKKAPTIKSDNYRELTDPQWVDRAHEFFCPRDAKERPVEWVLLASKIRSAKLKNTQNEELGKVEDLLLDRAHQVAFVIVGRGGVLGVGEHYIPVPWSKAGLRYNLDTNAVTVSLDATKAQLEKAPLIRACYELQ
jgi:hypothetical protein